MVELQIAHRKSNFVFSARFPVVKDVPGFPRPPAQLINNGQLLNKETEKSLNSGYVVDSGFE